VNEELLKI